MKLEVDKYTKFILTVIAIALLLNAAAPFLAKTVQPAPVHAGSEEVKVKIVDFRTTWPAEVKVTNWPDKFPRK